MNTTDLVLLLLIPLVLWRVYSRVRRLVGRQRSTLRRHWIGILVFTLLSAMLALGALRHPLSLGGLAAGLAAGTGLAIWGLKLTRFEAGRDGYFYTPNAHIGIALSLLFVGRILYRMVSMFGMAGAEAQLAAQDFSRSALTLLAFGTLAGYYIAYAIGVLRWRHGVKAARRAAAAARQAATDDANPPQA